MEKGLERNKNVCETENVVSKIVRWYLALNFLDAWISNRT